MVHPLQQNERTSVSPGGLKASLCLFLVVNPCFSGQDAVKCPGAAAVCLPQEPMMPCPGLGGDGW